MNDFKELPENIDDPIAILRNRNADGELKKESVLILVPIKYGVGDFGLAAISISNNKKHELITFFGKETDVDWIERRLKKNDLLYADTERFQQLINQLLNKKITNNKELDRHQSPSSLIISDSMNFSVSTRSDLVKLREQYNGYSSFKTAEAMNQINTEPNNTLTTYHNITTPELEKALAFGGFPVPSLAVVKADIAYDKYGEISLIANKDLVDPKNGVPFE